jgi:hypothetical protein
MIDAHNLKFWPFSRSSQSTTLLTALPFGMATPFARARRETNARGVAPAIEP